MNKILGEFKKVEQMQGNNGAVKNQFIITTSRGRVFQSYNSIICARIDGAILLDEKYWNYSITTSKYRNKFLNENTAETIERINNGRYQLVNLNEGE